MRYFLFLLIWVMTSSTNVFQMFSHTPVVPGESVIPNASQHLALKISQNENQDFNLPVVANQPSNLHACDPSGFSVFDLTVTTAEILGTQDPSLHTLTFHESLQEAIDNVFPIISPETYANLSNPQTIYARLELTSTGEFDTTSFDITVHPFPQINTSVTDLVVIDVDGDGIAEFDLTVKIPELLNGQSGLDVSFYETQENANTGNNEIQNPESYTNLSNPQAIYYRLEDNLTGCYSVSYFEIIAEFKLGIYNNSLINFSLSPNPANDILTVSSNLLISNIQILNQPGQLLVDIKVKKKDFQLEVSSLISGIYYVKIEFENSEHSVKKLIIE